jgi:enoyl-CoA hydratase/carnithine racemase
MTTDTQLAIRHRIDGAVATLTLNRPERHNSLDTADLALFGTILSQVSDNASVKAIILTGGDAKSFCSGASISDLDRSDWKGGPLERLVGQLEDMAVPTICALNGGVYGGGVEIALACDFRIAVDGVRCFVPPARLGIHYPVSGLKRFVSRVGLNAAKRLLLGVEELDATEMLRLGLVDRLVPKDELMPAAEALAARIAALAPLAVQGMKRTLNEIARGELDAAAAEARVARCWTSADHAEGKRAFAEKRAARFEGR